MFLFHAGGDDHHDDDDDDDDYSLSLLQPMSLLPIINGTENDRFGRIIMKGR